MSLDDWKELFDLSRRPPRLRHPRPMNAIRRFTSEEGQPPLGALTAAQQLGRGLKNLIVFNSLSKRSNVPGLRSGMVAGEAGIMKAFLLYRTYHGSAMSRRCRPPAWPRGNDEAHVIENRRQYAEKIRRRHALLKDALAFDDNPTPPSICGHACRAVTISRLRAAASTEKTARHPVLARQLLARDGRRYQPGQGLRPHRAGR